MGPLGRFLVLLGLREAEPEVRLDGVVEWVRMDEAFRSKCVVWSDGRCLVGEGYGHDPHVRDVLLALRDTGVVPDALREREGTLEAVAAAWRGGEELRGSRNADPEMAGKLFGILEQAIEAEADDVVLEKGAADCAVSVIVNNRKLPLGTPLTAAEGQWIVEHLFYCKNSGSRHTGIVEHEFQGWGVSSSELRMPASIAGLRCERGPDANGQHMVIRMFPKDRVSEDMTVEELGFSAEVSEIFREIRMSKYGGVIVAGSTGEGKSTTNTVNLITQMREHGGEINMATVEDPVENRIRGAIQIEVPTAGVGEDRSLHFLKGLMHFTRIHPQVGGGCEIRDAEGAKQILQFIDTGHQIWTTIHAHNANGVLFRLRDLGVEPAQLCKPGNIRLLLKQTLVSALCPNCSREDAGEGRRLPASLEGLLPVEVRYRNPEGCDVCLKERRGDVGRRAWAGYSNRRAMAEWIVPDEAYLAFVRQNDAIGAWRHWLDEMGGVTVGTRIWRAVGAGLVDPFDALGKGAQLVEAAAVFDRTRPALAVVSDDGEALS